MASSTDSLTPAQQLMAQHAADEVHRPTVEDAVDEEDIIHPPPSAAASAATAPVSEKAAGKQKARDSPAPGAGLNTQSEEAFPSLGAPKARAPVVNTSWSKKASAVANGANGTGPGNDPRSSAPASGLPTPTLSTPLGGANQGRGAPQGVSLPGRIVEQYEMAPSQMIPRAQLKKPIKDVLNEINRRSKAKVTMKEAAGKIVFEGQGPSEADVRNALREVAIQVGSKQSIKVPIPASLRPHIIGKQGSTVNKIKQLTGANIQLPKQDVVITDEDDPEIDVIIEGDAVGAELARRRIQDIVDERTSTVNLRLKDIPAELYPFLAGAFDTRARATQDEHSVQVKVPDYHYWTNQPPPQATKPGQPVNFNGQAQTPIQISGERVAAQQARAELEREVEKLRRELSVYALTVDKPRHQFIVGDRGVPHHDFLEETGCTIVLPPHHDDDDTIYIIGPANQLERGQNKAWDLSEQMKLSRVDVAKQHRQAAAGASHAKNLFQYLQQRRAIDQLEKQHEASIVIPSGGQTSWDIYTKAGKSSRDVNQDIVNVVASHPPSRLTSVPVDPFYIPHIRSKVAQQIRNDHGVFLAVPDEADESPELVLVYEASAPSAQYTIPRGQPSASETANFARSLQEAQKIIESILKDQAQIQSQNIEAPQKFHEKIRRYVDREQQKLSQDQVPVQVLGQQKSQRATGGPAGEFSIRGPSDALSEMYTKVLAFIEQEEKDEVERSYVTSCDFPQPYVKNLVGTQGSNINKLREEFDVEVNANEGKVDFKGPKAKAEAAKAHVLAQLKKWKDETTHELTIAPEYHRELIGAKGVQVNRLAERYGVRINFPRSNAHDDDADGASEAGHQRRSQAPNKVIIKGPSAKADGAKKELEELLKYYVEHSNSAKISVQQSQIPSLIGSGGREMEKIRADTHAQIDVPSSQVSPDASGRVEITIKGTKTAVEAAKKELQSRVKKFDETVTKTVQVDKKHHKSLIGAGGANIRDIVVKAGGSDDRRDVIRMVRFPPQDSEDSTIRVEGPKDIVNKIVAAIEELAGARDSQVTEVLDITPDKHRLLIGRGGEKRRSLESQFSITLDIPKQNVEGPARNKIRITGQPEAVGKAKEHILELVKDQGGETLQVPKHLHHVVSDNNNFFRTLRNEHKVRVDHGGQQPPPRPAASASRPKPSGGNLPLITDDPSASALSYSWALSEPQVIEESSETIPWILQGSPAAVAKAKELIEAKLQNASTGGSYTGYLGLPDPRSYGLIVGPGGSKINSLRKQTGTQITVPRNGADDPVEITGGKEGVEKAKDLIIELVGSQGQR